MVPTAELSDNCATTVRIWMSWFSSITFQAAVFSKAASTHKPVEALGTPNGTSFLLWMEQSCPLARTFVVMTTSNGPEALIVHCTGKVVGSLVIRWLKKSL